MSLNSNCWRLVPSRDNPSLFSSKIGGLPYWPPSQDYPTNSSGQQLVFLAQINFDEAHLGDPFPFTGLLQFFIEDDEVYGIDFDNLVSMKGHRVIYHHIVDTSVMPDAVAALDVPISSSVTSCPVSTELSLHFESIPVSMTGMDSESTTPLHQMLGKPFFTQEDPRSLNGELSYYDTLLLQIDSDGPNDILWGDCGVGNFFINIEDLRNCNFDHVMYTWDCS